MYPKVLVVFVVAAAVLAASLPATGEVGIVATASGHNHGFINILSFLGFVPTSLAAHFKVTIFKRDYMTSNDTYFTNDGLVRALVIICVFLEVILILITVWVVLYICILWRRRRQCLQRNAERQRAEQLLNSHPQPVDIELGAINARSAPHWPLTSNTETATTVPNTSDHQDTEGGHIWSETPAGSGAHDDGMWISLSKASNSEARDITEAAAPKIYVTNTETMQASKPEINNSKLDVVTSHTHVNESCLEPSVDHPTSSSTFYCPETEAAENNTAESSDLEDRLLTSTASKQAANASR
ncbi:hypothetical protein F5B21DRAFT_500477 [Xylaria acuta]|nr:hypothetical protein F5B21DRAFT_500477 [Xylaria acuta]